MDARRRKSRLTIYLAGLLVFCLLSNIKVECKHSGESNRMRNKRGSRNDCPGPNGPMNFTDFDNTIGMENGCYIVPDHIHYIRWFDTPMKYIDMIFVMSAFKNHKPEKIYFHYNNISALSGKYWDILMNMPGFKDTIVLEYLEMPTKIFGQELNKGWLPFHAGDIARVNILMKYGGIYLDNDVYVVKSLNAFRHYEFAVGWDNHFNLIFRRIAIGSQILIAHKDARILKLWHESFHTYRSDLWYYNGGERPAQLIVENPKTAHVVHYLFGNDDEWRRDIFNTNSNLWKKSLYSAHSTTREMFKHLNLENSKIYTFMDYLNETNILTCDLAIRDMALALYNPTNYQVK